ncbi:hypothetical protein EGV54_04695 [Staphylococcus pseudintermedius]|uniref:Uncharacterized protein n=1 Tax=Staphylococcus pseudintermedius TaxID=283734 RepID=A0A8H9BU78_STAPS|nr:hypothetical protein [Staphylococcus pseudintermedius]
MLDANVIADKVILGLPVNTPYGEFKPFSIEEYMKRVSSISILSYGKKKLLAELGKAYQLANKEVTDEKVHEMLKELYELPLFYLLKEYFSEYLQHYIIILRFTLFYKFDEQNETDEEKNLTEVRDFLFGLTDEEFDEIRKILMTLNNQTEKIAFLNPKIQRGQDKKELYFTGNTDDSPNLSTMITTCVTYSGIDFSVISKWNAFQLQHAFQRIAYLINYETTRLFATVVTDVDIENWTKNIDLQYEEKNTDKQFNEFKKQLSGIRNSK